MKIDRIKVTECNHKPLLNGLELRFGELPDEYLNANCFIGVNGSGKSQLLELIADIFLYLDECFRTNNKPSKITVPAKFEIEYSLKKKRTKFSVQILQETYSDKKLDFSVTDSKGNDVDLKDEERSKYIPDKVVGYTSGENETLSIPFHSYYDEYADYLGRIALNGLEVPEYETKFYFMDYNTNLGIAFCHLVFDNHPGLKPVKKNLGINKLKSFQIILQQKHTGTPNVKAHDGETGIVFTPELKDFKQFLIDSATCYSYDKKNERYILDFLFTKATQDAFKYFFKTPYKLYSAFYKFETLNNLMIDKSVRTTIKKVRQDRKLNTKMPTVPNKDKVFRYSELKLKLLNGAEVDYLSLSDGEHQCFNVFGTLLMMDQENVIFLLDEPETHFNPFWRRQFITNIKKITEKRNQDLFITTHSPFIVSDLLKDTVYIFNRKSKNKIQVNYPTEETFGASLDNALMMAFGLDDTLPDQASKKIESIANMKRPQEIRKAMALLGDSPELLSLYSQIEYLKSVKK